MNLITSENNTVSSFSFQIENQIYEANSFGNLVSVFKKENYLGKGAYSKCYKVKNIMNNKRKSMQDNYFAIKIFKKNLHYSKRQEQFDKIKKEGIIHKNLEHPNIVYFYDAFQDKENIYFILELCSNGYLLNLAKQKSNKIFPDEEIKTIINQVVFRIRLCSSK